MPQDEPDQPVAGPHLPDPEKCEDWKEMAWWTADPATVAIKDQVDAHVRDGHYQPYLDKKGIPRLKRTKAGEQAGAPRPLSEE